MLSLVNMKRAFQKLSTDTFISLVNQLKETVSHAQWLAWCADDKPLCLQVLHERPNVPVSYWGILTMPDMPKVAQQPTILTPIDITQWLQDASDLTKVSYRTIDTPEIIALQALAPKAYAAIYQTLQTSPPSTQHITWCYKQWRSLTLWQLHHPDKSAPYDN
jgi:hypothetical protein